MIKILTVPHTEFAARNLVQALDKLGHRAAIFEKPTPGDESLYIIYQANHVHAMPKNYILQQTEIGSSHWFERADYLKKIKKARAVWDYSSDNLHAYDGLNKNTMIVPPGVYPVADAGTVTRDIPYLFYGWIEGSARRRKIVDSLKSELGADLMIVTDKLRADMWSLLSRTKVVFNIHYHENSPLEAYRVGEAYSHNCRVLTECRRGVPHDLVPSVFGGYEFHDAPAPHLHPHNLIAGLSLAGVETKTGLVV